MNNSSSGSARVIRGNSQPRLPNVRLEAHQMIGLRWSETSP